MVTGLSPGHNHLTLFVDHRYHPYGQKDNLFAIKHLSKEDRANYTELFDNEIIALRRLQAHRVKGVAELVEEGLSLSGGRHLVLQ